jgi:hypothetical protein
MANNFGAGSAHGARGAQVKLIGIAHAGHDVDDDGKYAVAETEENFRGWAEAEKQNDERHQRHLRHGIKQQDDRIERFAREIGRANADANKETDDD